MAGVSRAIRPIDSDLQQMQQSFNQLFRAFHIPPADRAIVQLRVNRYIDDLIFNVGFDGRLAHFDSILPSELQSSSDGFADRRAALSSVEITSTIVSSIARAHRENPGGRDFYFVSAPTRDGDVTRVMDEFAVPASERDSTHVLLEELEIPGRFRADILACALIIERGHYPSPRNFMGNFPSTFPESRDWSIRAAWTYFTRLVNSAEISNERIPILGGATLRDRLMPSFREVFNILDSLAQGNVSREEAYSGAIEALRRYNNYSVFPGFLGHFPPVLLEIGTSIVRDSVPRRVNP
ncbi:MAG: hypothetical protein ABIH29_04730 [Candidatus Micrarchaeota archaeon]